MNYLSVITISEPNSGENFIDVIKNLPAEDLE